MVEVSKDYGGGAGEGAETGLLYGRVSSSVTRHVEEYGEIYLYRMRAR